MVKKIGLFILGSLLSVAVLIGGIILMNLLLPIYRPIKDVLGPFPLIIPFILFIIIAIVLWKRSKLIFSGYVTSILFLVLLVGLIFGWARGEIRWAFKDGEDTIAILEQYKKDNGHYPDTLEKVGLKSDDFYRYYRYDAQKDGFGLGYKVVFDSYFYNSETKKWSGDLPPGGVPYDLIKNKN